MMNYSQKLNARKALNRAFTFFLFTATLLIISCTDDEPVTPAASFTWSATETEVTFTNTSTNASVYEWDFGDGNSSTEESPTHTYRQAGTYKVTLKASEGVDVSSTSESIDLTQTPENARLNTGFVLFGVTEDGSARFGQHFDEIPTGTVDLSQGTSFQRFFPLAVVDGAIYSARTDGSSGFAKTGINGNKAIVEDGIIATISEGSFQIKARNKDVGVFHDRNSADFIQTFNPTTMTVTGALDMTLANGVVPDQTVRYQQFIFRNDDEFLAPMRTEAGGNITDLAMPIVSISGGGVTDIAVFEGLGDVIYFNGTRNSVDENGNTYVWHAGNLSVPTVAGSILKIPAGSNDYDPDFNFKVAEINNPAVTGFGSFMTGFEYWKDGKGFALVNESIDQTLLDLITERGGIQNFTPEDFNTALFLLFNSPTGAFVLVDLEAQTVTKVGGLPAVSVFAAGSATFIIDGEPYFGFVTPNENSLYAYNESSNTTNKVFDASGVQFADIVSLSEDF